MGRKAWKLKDNDVRFIRVNYPRFSGNQLARLFGVSQAMVYDIIKGNRRREVVSFEEDKKKFEICPED